MNKHEIAYIKWYIKTNKRNLLIIFLIFLISVTLPAILMPGNMKKGVYLEPLIISMPMLSIMTCLLSLVLAIYNFKHMMYKRSCDMYLAMPIKRSHFFYLQYFLGLICLLGIPFLSIMLAFFCDPLAMEVFPYYAFFVACTFLFCIAQYTIYTFLTLKCNNFWDAIIVCIAYTILPVFVLIAAYTMLNSSLSYAIVSAGATTDEIFNSLYASSFISVPATLIGYLGTMFDGVYAFLQKPFDIHMILTRLAENRSTSLIFVWYWLLASIIFFLLARKTCIKRSGEDAEQQTTSKLCYPVIIILVTMALLFGSGVFTRNFYDASLSLFIITIVVYGLMNFFARRKIKITKDMIIKFFVMLVVGSFLSYITVATKGFGQIHEYPEYENIKSVQVSIYFDTPQTFVINDPKYAQINGYEIYNFDIYNDIKTQAWIERFYTLHKEIVEESYTGRYGGYLQLQYNMKNGDSIRRSIGYDKDHLEEIHDLIQTILDEEKDKKIIEDIMQFLLMQQQSHEAEMANNSELIE